MKIQNSQPPAVSPVAESGAAGKVADGASTRGAAPASSPSISSSIEKLHAKLGDTTHDIDASRVDEVRQAIINGDLEMDPNKIADGLLENLRGR